MEQLCVHALLAQLYMPALLSEGEVPPAPGGKGFGGAAAKGGKATEPLPRPVWLGQGYQLQCQSSGKAAQSQAGREGTWQRGHWRTLSPLAALVGAPMEWVEPVLVAS